MSRRLLFSVPMSRARGESSPTLRLLFHRTISLSGLGDGWFAETWVIWMELTHDCARALPRGAVKVDRVYILLTDVQSHLSSVAPPLFALIHLRTPFSRILLEVRFSLYLLSEEFSFGWYDMNIKWGCVYLIGLRCIIHAESFYVLLMSTRLTRTRNVICTPGKKYITAHIF